MAKADLHVHTTVSDGMASVGRVLERAEQSGVLDVVAITDHEDAAGGLRARDLAAQRGYRVTVVPGAEITTIQGHLLCLFVEDTPKSFRSVESTLDWVHVRGGLAVIPHPMSWLTRSLSRRTIERICRRAEPGITFDAIETFNPSPAGRATGPRARVANALWGLPETGGSDAHHLLHLGTGWTEFAGATPEDLRAAIMAGTTQPGMSRYPSFREVGVTQTAVGLIWGYSATPRKMIRGLSPARWRTR